MSDLNPKVEAIERLVIELALISISSQHFTDTRKSQVSRLLDELQYAGQSETTCIAQKRLSDLSEIEKIGASWLENSSLEKWFPITAEEVSNRRKAMADVVRVLGKGCGGMANEEIAPAVESIRKSYQELYALVEAYLCTPNTSPAVADAYDRLVAWFVRNKRPDGGEPRPASPLQDSEPMY